MSFTKKRNRDRKRNIFLITIHGLLATALVFSSYTAFGDNHKEPKLTTDSRMLDAILRAAPSGIGVVQNRTFIMVNDYIVNLTGYSRNELVGKNARMLYLSDEEYNYVGKEKYRQIAEHRTGSVETRWIRKDGSIVDVVLSSTPIDRENPAEGVVFTVLDISEIKTVNETLSVRTTVFIILTLLLILFQAALILMLSKNLRKRKKAEKDLILKTDELENYFISALDLLCIADTNGNFKRVNKEWENVLGYSVDDLENKKFLDFIHPDDLPETLEVIQHLSEQESVLNFTNRYKCKDGSYRYIEWRSIPRGELIFAAARDVTDRKKSEEAVKESEEKYRALFEQSVEGIYLHDLYGNIVDVNNIACQQCGYSREELSLMTVFDLHLEKEIDKKIIISQWHNWIPNARHSIETYHKNKSGKAYPVEVSTGTIRLSNKNLMLAIVRDVTERKNAENIIRESEKRLRVLSDNLPGGLVYQIDSGPNGEYRKLTYISGGIEQLHEISLAEIKDNAMMLYNQVREEDRFVVAKKEAEALKTMSSFSAEVRVDLPSGKTRWSLFCSAPHISNGHIIWDGIELDITERKRSEEELIESHNRLMTVMNSIDAFIYIADMNTYELLFVNEFAKRTWGEGLIGRKCWEALQNMNVPCSFCTNDKLLTDDGRSAGICQWEFQNNVNKRWYDIRDCAIVWTDGRLVRMEIATDITARKEAETALRESEEKFRTLFASMTEMVALHEVVFDDQGNPVTSRITDCNAAYTQITGIPREQAIGKTAIDLYGTEHDPYTKEFVHVGITGEPLHFETYFPPINKHLSISVVSPGKNKFATVTTDISERIYAEKLITEKNKELERIIYVASHDLRSPLVNVDGYSKELELTVTELFYALEKGFNSQSELENFVLNMLPEIQSALKYIRSGTKQMDGLLKGLLKLSRTGRAAISIKNLDMNDLVARAVSAMEFQAKQSGATVKVSDLPPCRGDEMQVIQVFSNLIGNAIKFLDPYRPGLIEISGSISNFDCIYCVHDNGIGIPLKHQEKIYVIFHRVDPGKTEGEGLGLSIVRQILGRLGGTIRVESEEGKGSMFFVSLPKAKPAKRDFEGVKSK